MIITVSWVTLREGLPPITHPLSEAPLALHRRDDVVRGILLVRHRESLPRHVEIVRLLRTLRPPGLTNAQFIECLRVVRVVDDLAGDHEAVLSVG